MRASDVPGGRSVLRNTAFLAVSRILDRVSGFAVSLLIAPKLGATGLGTYFMLLYNGPATTPEASHEGWPEWFRASATSSSTEARR